MKGSVSWGETARSSKAELFLTAKTKLPVFMEIYTLPEKNGGKKSYAENMASVGTQVNGVPTGGPFLNLRKGEELAV